MTRTASNAFAMIASLAIVFVTWNAVITVPPAAAATIVAMPVLA